MKIRQLQYICEIAKRGCSISAAASALHTAQPGISKQLKALEDELGTRLFHRAGNRLSGLTECGEQVLDSARRVVQEIAHIRNVAREIENKSSQGELTIATTHTQARYVLPTVLKRFAGRHPEVRVKLRHGTPTEIMALITNGDADLGVTTKAPSQRREFVILPCHTLERVVIVASGHALLRHERPTLKSFAKYPLITYDAGFAGRDEVLKAFGRAGLTPTIALSATNVDVIKSCVEQDLGVAVVLSIIYDAERDEGIKTIPASHLFPPAKISVIATRRRYFRHFEYDFIEMLSDRWRRADIQRAARNRDDKNDANEEWPKE